MLFLASPGSFLDRCLAGQVGLRTAVMKKSGWEEEETGTDEERNWTLCQVRGLGEVA